MSLSLWREEAASPDGSDRGADLVLRGAVALAAMMLVALPFCVVTFPPVVDLPQHAAQIKLLGEALANDATYEFRWWVPYTSAYVVLGAAISVAGPIDGARLGVLAIAIGWVLSLHILALLRGRPASQALLASVFVFHTSLYWGFVSFLAGFPAFVIWVALTARPWIAPPRPRKIAAWIIVLAWIWTCHALWAGMAVAWLVALAIVRAHQSGKWHDPAIWSHAALALPLVVAGALFYPSMRLRSFDRAPAWGWLPTNRLSPDWLADGLMGGLKGNLEPIVLCALVAWVVLSLFQHRRDLRQAVDAVILGAAALLAAASLLLPDQIDNTIVFAQRWVAPAAALAFLGVPVPRVRPLIRGVAAASVMTLFFSLTAFTWARFESKDLSGLSEAVSALPERPRTVGLAFTRRSEFVRGYPFIQTFAWSQALRGGTLSFSFAEYAPFPVVFRDPASRPWTRSLEWYPTHLKASDLQYFDFALAAGSEADHTDLIRRLGFLPVTRDGHWRLYRIPEDLGRKLGAGRSPAAKSQPGRLEPSR